MGTKKKETEKNELAIDCRDLADKIVDLPPGGTVGLLTAQPNFPEVKSELLANQAAYGDKAGITTSDFESFKALSAIIDTIDARLPVARKIVELLEETRAAHEDERQRLVHLIATSVERRAKMQSGSELLAKYEKTCAYHSAKGVKAWKTRRRNAQLEAGPELETQPE